MESMQKNAIETVCRTFFWDVNCDQLDAEAHKAFVIERLLQYGGAKEVRWILETYSREDIIAVVKKSKRVDRKTANFWMIHFDIPCEEVLCLNRRLIHEQFY